MIPRANELWELIEIHGFSSEKGTFLLELSGGDETLLTSAELQTIADEADRGIEWFNQLRKKA